jgi:putative transposase
MILFGERSLRHVLSEHIAHHHTERPHQGKDNVILWPSVQAEPSSDWPIECRERLGGLLKYCRHNAA